LGVVVCDFALAVMMDTALAPAAAQSQNLNELAKQHEQHRQAGRYATLLSPVEALIKDKRHLLIVPSDHSPARAFSRTQSRVMSELGPG